MYLLQGTYKMRSVKMRNGGAKTCIKCEKRFYVHFYSLQTASLFNFCLSCDPFLGSVMSFILPVNMGVGDWGTYPKKSLKNIFAGIYYAKFGNFRALIV